MDKQREAPRGGNIDFHFRENGRREEKVTERTWALLIICVTVIFIAAIIADCIKSIKGRPETLENAEPEIRKYSIPYPPDKRAEKSIIFGEDGKINTEIFKN